MFGELKLDYSGLPFVVAKSTGTRILDTTRTPPNPTIPTTKMLTRRVTAAAAAAAPRSIRAITTTAVQQRAPLMADITTDQVDQFNNKQKQFRERLKEMKKEKEESRF